MFSGDWRAQELTCRAVAAIKKWGSGRKNILRDAAASLRIWFGGVLEKISRRVEQVEDVFVKSSMLWRYFGRRTNKSSRMGDQKDTCFDKGDESLIWVRDF